MSRKSKFGRNPQPVLKSPVAVKPRAVRRPRFAGMKPKLRPLRAPAAESQRSGKSKVSIAIQPELLRWVTERAEATGMSVSAVFADAVDMYKRHHDLGALLELAGGTERIPPKVQAQVDAEMREAGLIP